MGFSPGDYWDLNGVARHVESKSDRVRMHESTDEMGGFFDLSPQEARNLASHLLLAAHLIDGLGTESA